MDRTSYKGRREICSHVQVLKTLDRHIPTNIPDAMTTNTLRVPGDQPTESGQAHGIPQQHLFLLPMEMCASLCPHHPPRGGHQVPLCPFLLRALAHPSAGLEVTGSSS